jgi:RimJ/RimL family protein N-acetyltransferase
MTVACSFWSAANELGNPVQAGGAFQMLLLSRRGASRISTDDAVVGSCGLMRRMAPAGWRSATWLHPACTGRGLVTAAVAALVRQAFALPDID